MIRIRKYLPHIVAALVGAATLGAPSQAQAAFTVSVYDDNVLQSGVTATVVNNQLVLFGGSTTHFAVSGGQGSSNNPGLPTGAGLDLSTNERVTSSVNFFTGVANGDGSYTHTIRIVVSEDSFTAPTGTPLNLSSSTAGGSIGLTGGSISVAATNQAFLDSSIGNSAYGSPLAYATPSGGATGIATGTASLPPGITAPLNFNPGTVAGLVTGGTPFTMTDEVDFAFTLTSGSSGSAGVSTSSVATVPAPAGIVLALTSLPVAGVGGWLRRRQANTSV
jgi:hypothetical protein